MVNTATNLYDTSLCPPLEHLVQPPFLVVVRWPSQEQLGTQPPVLDVDGFFRLFQGNRYGVEVILAINIPFDFVAVSFWSEGIEAMALSDAVALLISGFLVLFVVAMVRIDEVAKLADFVFEVDGTDFGVVEVRSFVEDQRACSIMGIECDRVK